MRHFLSFIFLLQLSITIATADDGIASRYPGDKGIVRDPKIILIENFESPLAEVHNRWDTVVSPEEHHDSDDTPPGSSGKKSLLIDRHSSSSPGLYTRLNHSSGRVGFDKVHARYYVKFAEDCGEIHHFGTCLGGNNPPTPWPSVNAGQPTDGAKSFWSGIEPFGSSWTWDYYTYWHEMRGSPPRGQTWGNSFIHDPKLKIEKGKWICIEQMIRMNDIGQSNGEQALWIDGKLISHLKQGEPKGLWTFDKFAPGKGGQGTRWNPTKGDREYFDVPPGGAPFEGFNWRTDPKLNVNFVWLYAYTQKPAGHHIKVWFDDVVVATDYIGPIATATGDH
ncbi:MAG TPA: hypothetical protein VM510_15720 [Caulifigura sp.]|nr:hypothetical protein [Caulifigura sp.]